MMRGSDSEERAPGAVHPLTSPHHNDVRAPDATAHPDDDGTSPLQDASPYENGSVKKDDGNALPEGEAPAPTGFLAKVNACVNVVLPPGGVLASAFNLASSSIGAGILGLPLAANSSGLVMAVLYLAVITFLTIYSMYALGVAAQRTQISNFEGIAVALMGRWFALFVACVRVFHGLSGCVAYVISVGDIFKNILKNSNSAPQFLKETNGNRLLDDCGVALRDDAAGDPEAH
ncbi:amino acid transporter [Trypanosoma conorhini]|uniref:Amino acid transporter n=1 Tax=Trypanosoma conorhini TaxID=83891 RepID=A0A3R7L3N0_9TRYP|nr:amino acid transporter [Trypanosoma conorhini]RNF06930.1 amino acid transporter [Trypanosoma conorhini]